MISSLNDFLYSEFAEQQPNDDDWGNTFNIEWITKQILD